MYEIYIYCVGPRKTHNNISKPNEKNSQTAQSAHTKITEMKAIGFGFKAIDGRRLDNATR